MICPSCGRKTEVLDSRLRADNSTLRRRICPNGHRFSTEERIAIRERDVNALRFSIRNTIDKQFMQFIATSVRTQPKKEPKK